MGPTTLEEFSCQQCQKPSLHGNFAFSATASMGENTVTTRNAEHEVEQASMVVTDSYRQAYGIAMYERPDVLEVIDRTSLDADYPACPCATTTL